MKCSCFVPSITGLSVHVLTFTIQTNFMSVNIFKFYSRPSISSPQMSTKATNDEKLPYEIVVGLREQG